MHDNIVVYGKTIEENDKRILNLMKVTQENDLLQLNKM